MSGNIRPLSIVARSFDSLLPMSSLAFVASHRVLPSAPSGQFLRMMHQQQIPIWVQKLAQSAKVFFTQPYFCPDDGLYLLSNEENQLATTHILEKDNKISGAVHIGVGGWQNYDMIVARDSDCAILVDINEATCQLHEMTRDAILQAGSIDEFIEIFLTKLEASGLKVKSGTLDQIKNKELYWLQKPSRFEKIKEMFRQDKIKISRANIASPEFIDLISVIPPEKRDTLYISNVADWLVENPVELDALDHQLRILTSQNPRMKIVYADGTFKDGVMNHYPMYRKISKGYTDIKTKRSAFRGVKRKWSSVQERANYLIQLRRVTIFAGAAK